MYVSAIGEANPRSGAITQDISATVASSSSHSTHTAIQETAANWIAASSTTSDGAIFYTMNTQAVGIEPYYGNIAAFALATAGLDLPVVERQLDWYLTHSQTYLGLPDAVCDWTVVNHATGVSLNRADSTDSYPASFLLAANAYRASGVAGEKWFGRHSAGIFAVANELAGQMNSDGLTYASPDYLLKYSADNSEVWAGLTAAERMFPGMYERDVEASRKGVLSMYSLHYRRFAVYVDARGAYNWGNPRARFYPDSVSSLYPIVYGLISPTDPRALEIYAGLNANWPTWDTRGMLALPGTGGFPQALVGYLAAVMGDTRRAALYLSWYERTYQDKGFPWSNEDLDAGWYLQSATMLSQHKLSR